MREEATEHERKLIGLQEYTRELLTAESRAGTARVAVEAAHEVLGAPLVGFHDHDPEHRRLGTLASVDTVRDELGGAPVYERTDDNRVAQLVWGVFQAGEPVYIDDMRAYDAAAAEVTPAASCILRPVGDRGLFIASSTTTDAFDESDRLLVEILVDALAAALRRVERERLLQQRTNQLRRENDRLNEFAGVVSHDLRNPLNVAVGRVDLAREAAERAAVVEQLNEAEAAMDRAFELIDDLLTLARDGQTVESTESVPLAAVVAEAWGRVEAADAALSVQLGDERVEADRSRLTELFENLFHNSVEHGSTDSSHRAIDRSERAATDGTPTVTVTVGTLADGFYVADDGPGIPESERERVFERGYTTSDSGTGFGLRIVRDIAGGHGWSVSVTESEAGGARFEVTGVDITD
ncbi:sensor histidine kinase [Halosegnis sp.]|uniref:sensor histidine kinase n=1 Tax=Halosegnis sp. TaxID=2864959 RepID=UPI0035D3F5DC